MLLPIENSPRDYAWGARGAISAWLGRGETDAVEAELWLGSHHGSPARLTGGGGSLAAVVPELPFLLKLLAADSPLSLQAHPDPAQARDGFERETALGIPLDAPERNYKDPGAKPELVVALSPGFEAVSGFRPVADARADIARLTVGLGQAGDTVAPLVDRLVADETIGDAFVWLLEGSSEARDVIAAVETALRQAPSALEYASRIAERHPGDPGIVGALLLHHVVLRAGEALYLPAGNVHAYLEGVGIELMSASDNVLRGGLTAKHVDVPELARVLDRAARPVPRLEPVPMDGGGILYAPEDPGVEFSLAFIDSSGRVPLAGPAIALCGAGAFVIRGAESTIEVVRGQAILATPDEAVLEVEGSGGLYLAR